MMAWLFFHDITVSPSAIFGVACLGAWAHVALTKWRERR